MSTIRLATCTKCGGTGKISVVRKLVHDTETCPKCNGSGVREVKVEVL